MLSQHVILQCKECLSMNIHVIDFDKETKQVTTECKNCCIKVKLTQKQRNDHKYKEERLDLNHQFDRLLGTDNIN